MLPRVVNAINPEYYAQSKALQLFSHRRVLELKRMFMSKMISNRPQSRSCQVIGSDKEVQVS